MKTDAVVKKAGSALTKFGSATLGLAAGSFAGNKISSMLPTSLPGIVAKMLPGTLLMVGAVVVAKKFDNENAEAAAIGLGLAGFANLAKNFLPDSVSSYIPLNGVAGMGNTIPDAAVPLVLNGPVPDANPMNYLAAATGMAV